MSLEHVLPTAGWNELDEERIAAFLMKLLSIINQRDEHMQQIQSSEFQWVGVLGSGFGCGVKVRIKYGF